MTVTETQKANLIPFKKGDKRINRKGRRVGSFVQLRKLAVEIANEVIGEEEGITRIRALLSVMSTSRNPADRKTFLEYAFGKPKDEVDVTTGGEKVNKVIFEYVQNPTATITQPADTNQENGEA